MSYLHEHAQPRHPRATPQSQPIPNTEVPQVQNHAGGYSWQVDEWTRLDRFLILGSEGGTFYVGQQKLTAAHLKNAEKILTHGTEVVRTANGMRLVARVDEVSQKGLAPKNDPALYVLALATVKGTAEVRAAAYTVLPNVARTSTHLFDFLTYRQSLGGWGRGLRRAVSNWYLGRSADSLAYQVVKYRQRNGWTHRDAIRKAHVNPSFPQGATVRSESAYLPDEPIKADILRYVAKGADEYRPKLGDLERVPDHDVPAVPFLFPHRLVQGYEMASRSPNPKVTAGLIREFKLPREAVPTEHLTSPEVWEALLDDMPITALIRNLATMTRVGTIAPLGANNRRVIEKLTDIKALAQGRVHPIQLLVAARIYGRGKGERGSSTWKPVPQILDALQDAFYLSFGTVTPTGKATLIGLDVSGSMRSMGVNGVPGLTAYEAESAMSLIVAATEPAHGFVAFDTQAYPLAISPRQRLQDVVRDVSRIGGGGTNCALPIVYAMYAGLPVEVFVVYTDSETWQGDQHPAQAIREYRQKTGIPAKLVVVAMASSKHTIADPGDSGVMNVVGFDPSVPNLISTFVAG